MKSSKLQAPSSKVRRAIVAAEAIIAARNMDWMQVVLNGGPPCFHIEGGRFCGRAQRWQGHGGPHGFHNFVSLADLLCEVAR